jgi:hypothetical protein
MSIDAHEHLVETNRAAGELADRIEMLHSTHGDDIPWELLQGLVAQLQRDTPESDRLLKLTALRDLICQSEVDVRPAS